MANDQQNTVSDQDKQKLITIKNEEHFFAVDFSDSQYREYKNSVNERYSDINKIEKDVVFTERMLGIPTTAELSFTEEERSQVRVNLNRKKNFLLLNDKSRDTDSKEMERVKRTVGELEFHLHNEEFLNLKSIHEISNYYDEAIEACRDYIKNKNPWFGAGIKRKDKVRETMKNLRQERSLLLTGGELLRKGYINRDEVKTPYDLICTELTRYREEKKENVEYPAGEDTELAREIRIARKAGKDTSYLEWRQQTGHKTKVQSIVEAEKSSGHDCQERAAEMLDALSSAQQYMFTKKMKDAEKNSVKNGYLMNEAEFSRTVCSLLYCPKFKDANTPLNDEEKKKEEWNQKWINCFTAKPKPSDLLEKRRTLMRQGLERVLSYPIPSPEEIREIGMVNYIRRDPFRYRELVMNSTGLQGLKELDPEAYNEIIPPGSALDKKTEAMSQLVSLGSIALQDSPYFIMEKSKEGKHIFDVPEADSLEEEKVNRRFNALQARHQYEQSYRDAMNTEAMEKLKKEKEALKDDVNAEKPAHIQKQNPDVIKEDVFLEQASVLAHKQLDELKALKDRAERVGVLGANGSKILAAGFYFVKKNAGGEPLSEDEKRKADHNKKWIAAWNKWLDTKDPQKGGSYFENRMEETKARRTIMSYYSRFLRDMVRTPIPYSNEMYCSATARIFASRDPYTFLNLQTAVEGMELLKGQFEDEMKTVEQDIGGLTEFGNTIEAMKKIVSGDGADCRQHLADYQKNYKKLQEAHGKTLSERAGASEPGKIMVHYKLLKDVNAGLYRNIVELDAEAENEKRKFVQSLEKERKKKLVSGGAPEALALALKDLGDIKKDQLKEIVLDINKIEGAGKIDTLSEEDVEDVMDSVELIIGKLLTLDLEKLEKLTVQDVVKDYKHYRAIHFLLSESNFAVMQFYKDARKKYPSACKYKESDIMWLEMLYKHYSKKISNRILRVSAAGQYFKDNTTAVEDPEVIQNLSAEELATMQQDDRLRSYLTPFVEGNVINKDRDEEIKNEKLAIEEKKKEEQKKEEEEKLKKQKAEKELQEALQEELKKEGKEKETTVKKEVKRIIQDVHNTRNYKLGIMQYKRQQQGYQQNKDFKKYYKEIESTPDAMDKQLVKVQGTGGFLDNEDYIAQVEKEKLEVEQLNSVVNEYTGDAYRDYNGYLRGKRDVNSATEKKIIKMKEGLKEFKIDRNIVVRRAVPGLAYLQKMLNLKVENRYGLYAENLKEAIQEKIEHRQGKPVILKEPAFVSTCYAPDFRFLPKDDNGIEFIINVKKGTQAVNVTALSNFDFERELILNAGTKFRLVKIYYNGCEGEEQRPLAYEQLDPNRRKQTEKWQKIWKVYLETIPSNEEGQLK